MWHGVVDSAHRLVQGWSRFLFGDKPPAQIPASPASQKKYAPLERLVLTDEVCRTLFSDFAGHRAGARGDEEIGWLLLGRREETHALALATLPAGTERNAGFAHVQFNSNAQALGSRILRQLDKQLVLLGVVHTHPGSLRHPSGGDFRGDSAWVGKLRGGEGVFGIGTAEGNESAAGKLLQMPECHRQVLGDLDFSWYVLGQGDSRYRRLPTDTTLGPDLARPLYPLWDVLEAHAESLENLCRQQANVVFEVTGSALQVTMPLATPASSLRLVLDAEEVRYVVEQEGILSGVDPDETTLDRAVYLILAELARFRQPGLERAAVKKRNTWDNRL